MTIIPAIFDNGVFRPETPVSLPPGTRVQVSVCAPATESSDDEVIARVKRRFPRTTGAMAPDQAAELQRIVDDGCGQVNPDGWR